MDEAEEKLKGDSSVAGGGGVKEVKQMVVRGKQGWKGKIQSSVLDMPSVSCLPEIHWRYQVRH